MAETKTSLAAEIKKLSIVNIAGTTYLAKVKKIEGGIELTEAVETKETFEDSVAAWIKANNIGELEEITSEGIGASFSKKNFNEEQKMQIDIIAAKAEYAIKYAVAELQNSKF